VFIPSSLKSLQFSELPVNPSHPLIPGILEHPRAYRSAHSAELIRNILITTSMTEALGWTRNVRKNRSDYLAIDNPAGDSKGSLIGSTRYLDPRTPRNDVIPLRSSRPFVRLNCLHLTRRNDTRCADILARREFIANLLPRNCNRRISNALEMDARVSRLFKQAVLPSAISPMLSQTCICAWDIHGIFFFICVFSKLDAELSVSQLEHDYGRRERW